MTLQKSVFMAFGDKAIFGPNKDVREIGIGNNHNTEVRFYELLRKYEVTDIPTPKVYFTREFIEGNTINGHLIMEYIADGTVLHLLNNVTPEHMAKAPGQFIEKLCQFGGDRFRDKVDQMKEAIPEIVDAKIVEEITKSL
ncbi:hypothetical protein OSTOST_21330, partial [Ostertagia ostertagi]